MLRKSQKQKFAFTLSVTRGFSKHRFFALISVAICSLIFHILETVNDSLKNECYNITLVDKVIYTG